MRYSFVQEYRLRYPVRLMCRVLRVSSSGFHAWLQRPTSRRAASNDALLAQIRRVFSGGRGSYGIRRVHAALKAEGRGSSRNRVARLMRAAGLGASAKRHRVKTTDSPHGLPVAPNVLDRQFGVQGPARAWVSDITYIPTKEGWLYLAMVMDTYSRRIIGWAMADTLETELVAKAVRMAARDRQTSGVIFHSDRGSQYASNAIHQLLLRLKMRQSMSRRAECYDNALAESFFGKLKNELVHCQRYQTRNQARASIFEYIEVFYNRQRLHSSLNYLSPVQFEQNNSN